MGTRACGHISDESSPAIGEGGKTGEWRSSFPLIDQDKCTPAKQGKPACFLCWLYCPEAVIDKSIPVSINLEYCKGCGICAYVCPTGAISLVSEDEAS